MRAHTHAHAHTHEHTHTHTRTHLCSHRQPWRASSSAKRRQHGHPPINTCTLHPRYEGYSTTLVRTSTCTCTYTHPDTYLHIAHALIKLINAHTRMCTQDCTLTLCVCTCTQMHTGSYTCMYMCMHLHTYAHRVVHMHVDVYAHTRIYTQGSLLKHPPPPPLTLALRPVM